MKRTVAWISCILLCIVLSVPALAAATEQELTALTEEEQALWYAKYYHETPASPGESVLAALQSPMDAEDIIAPEDIAKLFDFETPFVSGYAVMDNGVTYSAVETVFEGVTLDMYRWYQSWSAAQENQQLIYKIWFPGKHVKQELLNGTMWIQEDIGMGIENIFATGTASLSSLGLSGLVENNDSILMAMVTKSISTLAAGTLDDNPIPSSLIHIYYVNDDGYVTDRVAAWFGGSFVNGSFMVNVNGNEHSAAARAKGMAEHMAGEDANMAAVIREVYEENRDTFTASGNMGASSGEPS